MSLGKDAHQEVVERYFDAHAGHWLNIYEDLGLRGTIYRRRMETALQWIQELGLPAGAPALEVGCGAGLLAVELAHRGLSVFATDSSPEMVSLATKRAAVAQPPARITVQEGDVRRLPVGDGEFSLVVALGLLPWLRDPEQAIAEMARVLAPEGWIILSADNRARLNFLLEPRENPLLTPLRLAYRAHKRRRGQASDGAPHHLHLPSEIDHMLEASALTPMRRTTIGFGPFTFRGTSLLPETVGTRLHWRLERSSARHPTLRRTGWHYLVEAQKSPN